MQSAIREKIAKVESSIQNVAKVRRDLEENSISVKAEVQRSVSAHLDSLRQREVQLLRQVDALISHQSSMLQMQLSKLYQVLGRCKAASHWATTEKDFHSLCLNEEELNSISTCHIQYEPMKEGDLSFAIQHFGRLEAKGAARNVFLLPEEEEYGDGDHHILHKTIQEDLANKIRVSFPKLSPKSEEWLLDSKKVLDEYDLCETSSDFSKGDSIELLTFPDSDGNLWLTPRPLKESCTCLDKGTIEIENLDSLACVPNAKPQKAPFFSIPKLPTVCKSLTSKCSTFKDCVCEDESCLVTNLREQLKKQNMDNHFQEQDSINKAIKEAYRFEDWLHSKPSLKEHTKTETTINDSSYEWLADPKATSKRIPNNWLQDMKHVANDTLTWLANDSNKQMVVVFEQKTKDVMQTWLQQASESKPDTLLWLLPDNAKVSESEEKIDKPESATKKSKDVEQWVTSTSKGRNAISKQMYSLYFHCEGIGWLANQNRSEKGWLI